MKRVKGINPIREKAEITCTLSHIEFTLEIASICGSNTKIERKYGVKNAANQEEPQRL